MGLDWKSKILGLVEKEKDSDSAFNQIEKLTGNKLDEQNRAILIKAGVEPDKMLAGALWKQIKASAVDSTGANIIARANQPGGLEALQKEYTGGVKATAGGASVEVPASEEIIKKESMAKGAGEAAGQEAKAAELAGRDALRANAAADTAFDAALAYGEKQMESFGTRPGELFGWIDKATPSQFNEFKDAFQGATREGASLIARQLIPGVRAANITKIFEKSLSSIGKTMESNSYNHGYSLANTFANALGQNIRVATEDGKEAPIQDVTIDKKTGRPLSQLGFQERSRAINDLKREFGNQVSQDLLERTYKRNPALLQPLFSLPARHSFHILRLQPPACQAGILRRAEKALCLLLILRLKHRIN